MFITDHIWSPDGRNVAYIKVNEGENYGGEFWVALKSSFGATLTRHRMIYKGCELVGLEDWKDDWILFLARWEGGTPSVNNGTDELWKIRDDGTDLTQITFTNTNKIRTEFWNTAYTNKGTVSWGRVIPGTDLIYFSAHNGNGWYKSFVFSRWKLSMLSQVTYRL